jgi:hypothetical protein
MESYTFEEELALQALEVLRLTPIYTLLNSEHEDELGDDFKPHKWESGVQDHAELAYSVFSRMLEAMTNQAGLPPVRGALTNDEVLAKEMRNWKFRWLWRLTWPSRRIQLELLRRRLKSQG